MLVLLPALVMPMILVRAAEPFLDAPDQVAAGTTFSVRGDDFDPGAPGTLYLDWTALTTFVVGTDGDFSATVTVPVGTRPGRHALVARGSTAARASSSEITRSSVVVSAGTTVDPSRWDVRAPRTALRIPAPTSTLEVPSLVPTPAVTPAPTPAATLAAVVTPAPVVVTPAPVVTAPATPAPPAPPPTATGRTFYMAPGGSDGGDGSSSSPWATYAHASNFLRPGDTLYARGGTYSGQGGYGWNPAASGTAGAPISFRAAPGETPIFDGANVQEQFLIFHGDTHHVVVDGLRVQNYHPYRNGIIVFYAAHDIVLQNLVMTGNRGSSSTPIEHLIYPGAYPYNLTIRNNFLDAAGMTGGAIHMYHDPGPRNVLIEGNTIRNGYWGVIVASSADGVTIRGNAFSGNRRANIEVWSSAVNVVVSGNSPNDTVYQR